MDLSKVSTEDLRAYQSGDLTKVSTAGLKIMQAGNAPDPRGAKIDTYLAETDTLLSLPAGTSARQIHQESKFKDDAVSPVGARGLAQMMPATVQSLSGRLGRKLDPHNTDDALLMHREVMRENIAKFGNPDDALRAYNAGWDKKKWANPETEGYLQKINGGAKPVVPFGAVPKDVNPALLKDNQDWLRASRQVYSLRERKQFDGTDADLAEWGKSFMGNFNSNMVDLTRYAHDLKANGTDGDKQAFMYLMDTYDNTDFSFEGAGRAAKGIFTDPTTYVGLGTIGIGTVGKVMATAAAKQGIKKMLLTGLGRTGIIAGVESGAMGGFESVIKQGVEVTGGRREEVDAFKVAGDALIAGTAGVVLGTAGDMAVSAIAGVIKRGAAQRAAGRASGGPAVAPVVPPAATPSGAAAVAPASPGVTPASASPDPVSGVTPPATTGLTSDEIIAATARQQKGRLWVDDLNPVTPANGVAADQIGIPVNPSGGMRATAQSMPELQANGDLVAAQLRGLPDDQLHGVLEHFRQTATVDNAPIMFKGVQILKNEMVLERLTLSKELPGATPERATEILTKLDALDARMIPVQLADDAMGSFSGSLLNQRQFGIPIPADANITDLMAKGMTRLEAETEYSKIVSALQLKAASSAAAKKADDAIQAAISIGDHAEAARLQVLKYREMDALVAVELPGNASWTQKLNEYVISGIFTPTTLAINLIPAAVKTLMTPLLKAMVSDPLLATTRREMTATYSAMFSTMGASRKAAWASLKYEQSLLTRDNGRLLEGELALTGRLAGGVRLFPRLLNATDEFLGQMNYNGFIAGRAAATALVEGQAKGLAGKDLTDYVKLSSKIAMEEAFLQKDGESLIQPLVNKGVNLGYTGEKLWSWVEKEALKSPEALRHGSDDDAIAYVRDILYKRQFSGEGAASSVAQAYEKAMMKVPSAKLIIGQLFFRTPIRVFEEGIRLTPGLQIIAPGFISDLAGKNGPLRQARANAEALTSISMTGAILSLYASGSITGDGAHDNWRQGRTAGDGPAPAPYTIKMPDGSTWSYRNFDPIATPFKIIINGLERMDKLAIREAQGELVNKTSWDQAMAFVTVGTGAIASALRDANLVAGLEQSIKLAGNLADPEAKEGAWLKYFGEKLSLVVPNTLHKIAKTNDPSMKDPADFWQVVETRLGSIGVDRSDIKTTASYDVLGNPRKMTDSGTLWNVFSTATPEEYRKGHSAESQAVMLEINRLQNETGAVFTPPLKHKMTGDLDLRTILTSDKSETLYDRWQKNYRALEPDKRLYPIATAEMPDGTRKVKGMKVEQLQGVMNELRDAAFMQMVSQEQRVIDEVIKLELGKASAKSGQLDFGNRNK